MPPNADHAPTSPVAAIAALRQQAGEAGQRALVVVAGDPAWGRQLAQTFWEQPENRGADRLWLSDQPGHPGRVPLRQAVRWLGREHALLVIDTHAGFSADAFGAISGTLVSGGLLLLLSPPLDKWPDQPAANPFGPPPSRFIRHLVATIEQDPALLLIQQPARVRPPRWRYQPAAARRITGPCRTADQQHAVAALLELGETASPRPLVITSDRGRGKSAALGIAAAGLLEQQAGYRIGLCAPRPQACAAVFERAAALLPQGDASRNRLELADGGLKFFAADALLADRPPLDLLFIDEAAAFPLPVLEALLDAYSRVAFASTVHGYEGTGQGFALRFARLLDRRAPNWRAIRLTEPIRWRENDPLEQFVFRALLLDAEPADPDPPPAPGDCRFVELPQARLIDSPETLRQLFGLLVLAHYRTRPEDLYRLLDAPDLRLFAMEHAGRPLAVAVIGIEGGFDPATAGAIYRGRRRPPGHLLAQSLAFHAGVPDAARYRYARILRVGVHPALQRRGLGSALLDAVVHTLAEEAELDAIGASFSASAELLPFWQRAGFTPVRVGLTRDHTSGRHAALVLKPFSRTGGQVYQQARHRFEQHWPALRAGPLQDLSPALADQLQPAASVKLEATLNAADREDIDSFVHGLRGFEVCAWPIEKLLRALLADPARSRQLAADDRSLLIRRVVDKQDWPAISREFKLAGQKAARLRLREAVGRAWQLWEKP